LREERLNESTEPYLEGVEEGGAAVLVFARDVGTVSQELFEDFAAPLHGRVEERLHR
jgi:hypothetical protein